MANSTKGFHFVDLPIDSLKDLYTHDRGESVVAVGAYCLMPNHFHLLLREITEGGITAFMQRLGTAYTMYFNKKYERTGGLFTKPFRSKHVADDRYLQHLHSYIHCNSAEIFDRGWKHGKARNLVLLERKMREYTYSSLPDSLKIDRIQGAILDHREISVFQTRSFRALLAEADEYYKLYAPEATPRGIKTK